MKQEKVKDRTWVTITVCILFWIYMGLAECAAQKITTDSQGNFVQVKDTASTGTAKLSGKTFTDASGKKYPVWVSAKGKYFVIRTSKTGNKYKQYLKLN